MQIEVAGRGKNGPGCGMRRLLVAIAIAQVLSVALAATGISSAALSNQGINAPTTQAFLNYCLLAVVFGGRRLVAPAAKLLLEHWRRLTTRGTTTTTTTTTTTSSSASRAASRAAWRRLLVFAALALLDVEANTLVTKAYQYTSLTSVTLLDCFTIPCVMLLSWLILRTSHRPAHYAGAACCVAGLAVLVVGDAANTAEDVGHGLRVTGTQQTSSSLRGLWQLFLGAAAAPGGDAGGGTLLATGGAAAAAQLSAAGSAGSAPLLGDALVLLGATLYAVCNVTQEMLLGDVEVGQLLAYLGLFGGIISGLQAWLLEQGVLRAVQWTNPSVAVPMAGFALSMFLFYSAVPRVLILGGATVLNLSLLTSDAWSALARFMWFGGFQGSAAAYFLTSLLLVAAGIAMYAVSGSPKEPQQQQKGDVCSSRVGAAATGGPVLYSRVPDVADEEMGQQQQQLQQGLQQ